MRVIPKRHWARSQRRRVHQTRFAHPVSTAAERLERQIRRSEMALAQRCAAGSNAAVQVWLQDAATTL